MEPDSDGGRAQEEEEDDFHAPSILFPQIRGRYRSDLLGSDVNKERRFSARVRTREQRECNERILIELMTSTRKLKRVPGSPDLVLINTRSQLVQAQHLTTS